MIKRLVIGGLIFLVATDVAAQDIGSIIPDESPKSVSEHYLLNGDRYYEIHEFSPKSDVSKVCVIVDTPRASIAMDCFDRKR